MELGTLGAIVKYALELEEQALAFYEANACGQAAQVFGELAGESRKRLSLLAQARRECVVEMILEPIAGLESQDYRFELPDRLEEGRLLPTAMAMEENLRRFMLAASEKVPIRSIVRTLQRLARQNEARLQALAGRGD